MEDTKTQNYVLRFMGNINWLFKKQVLKNLNLG